MILSVPQRNLQVLLVVAKNMDQLYDHSYVIGSLKEITPFLHCLFFDHHQYTCVAISAEVTLLSIGLGISVTTRIRRK